MRIRDFYPGSRILISTHSGSRIQDPGSRIPDPKTATKEKVEKTFVFKPFFQCCGSMTFWGGSGSGSGTADLCLWLMDQDSDSDPDSDPDPGSGSCYLRHWPSRCQQKTNFLTQFFLLLTFWSYIYIIFQRWKVKASHKIVGIKVFLTIFADDRRIRIRIQSRIGIRIHTSDLWIRILEAQKHVDPDPDPQHCFFEATNFTKWKYILFFKCWRKKCWPIFKEL